jgi:hypothetical protein
MATKPIFRVLDIPADSTAQQMEQILNGPSEDGYSLQSLSFTWPGVGARAVFKLPAQRVGGRWVRGED